MHKKNKDQYRIEYDEMNSSDRDKKKKEINCIENNDVESQSFENLYNRTFIIAHQTELNQNSLNSTCPFF